MKRCLSCNKNYENSQWKCVHCHKTPKTLGQFPAFAPHLAEANESFDPTRFGKLFNIQGNHFWFRSRNQLLLWALDRFFPKAESFFEIGCGTGFVLAAIKNSRPELNLCATDVFITALKFASRQATSTELFQMDVEKIPFAEEFDVIGAFDVLEHVEDDELVLKQISQAVKPGGGILITVPQHPFLWSQRDDMIKHKRRYRATELRNKVEASGFEVMKMTSFVSVLFPFLLLSRLKPVAPEDEFDPHSEFSINPIANILFEKALGMERLLIRAGISFPIGGSLLMVGRKPDVS